VLISIAADPATSVLALERHKGQIYNAVRTPALTQEVQMSVQSETCQFSNNIICPKCGAVGVVVWETADGQTSLVKFSNGFYEHVLSALVKVRKAMGFQPKIVSNMVRLLPPMEM
jgi:hypothetical protein